MSTLLKDIEEVNGMYKKLREKSQLLRKLNVIRMGKGVIELDKGITFETIYSNNGTVTITRYPKMGARTPSHCHDQVKEYLICNKGSFSVHFGGNFRVLKIKDCVSVPEGVEHTTTALEDNSELIAVCVPIEPLYAASMACNS